MRNDTSGARDITWGDEYIAWCYGLPTVAAPVDVRHLTLKAIKRSKSDADVASDSIGNG